MHPQTYAVRGLPQLHAVGKKTRGLEDGSFSFFVRSSLQTLTHFLAVHPPHLRSYASMHGSFHDDDVIAAAFVEALDEITADKTGPACDNNHAQLSCCLMVSISSLVEQPSA